ncbi:RNA-guided endonuclease InsQ/TnpB family protein [Streptomyces nojiriensis]|uniref:RNA-guided endonuclease InsQ/TnpB family protein n=1 Tax=Streptomyces nojiriensis TaxID=66374 RepID=UPI0035D8E3DB
MKRSFKYRFYPTDAQAVELSRTFGCVRKVCNLALAARAEAWKARGERMGYGQTSAMLTAWKKTEVGKARTRVARIHARIADRRRDFLHQLTTRLVRESQTLVIEDLTVSSMPRNHELARSISDAAWRELRSMLEYETAWYGRELIAVDRWFPSSKLCSACGVIADAMPLGVREWTCESCGTAHGRDGNAAVNLLAAGLASAACGADVRPHRESSSRSGRSVAKRESPRVSVGIPSR